MFDEFKSFMLRMLGNKEASKEHREGRILEGFTWALSELQSGGTQLKHMEYLLDESSTFDLQPFDIGVMDALATFWTSSFKPDYCNAEYVRGWAWAYLTRHLGDPDEDLKNFCVAAMMSHYECGVLDAKASMMPAPVNIVTPVQFNMGELNGTTDDPLLCGEGGCPNCVCKDEDE
jgi:hypothetical protein